MRYVCLIYFDPKRVFDGSQEGDAVLAECGPHEQRLQASGRLVLGQPLALPNEAATVQVRNGKVSVTDGPFIETREMLGGLVVVEARDMNEALQIAAEIPFARLGSIEVRPVPDYSKPRPRL